VLDWVDAVAATAAKVFERLAAESSLSEVDAAVVGVLVAAAVVEFVAVDVFDAAAMQPVRAKRLATLAMPATLRARRAGWGRRRGDPVVLIGGASSDWFDHQLRTGR